MTPNVTDIYLDHKGNIRACPVHRDGAMLLEPGRTARGGRVLVAVPGAAWDALLAELGAMLARKHAASVERHQHFAAAYAEGRFPLFALLSAPPENPPTPPLLKWIRFCDSDHCAECGVVFGRHHASVKFCSTRCKVAATRRMAAENARRRRSEGRITYHTCQHCAASFEPKRADARFCSGRCRVAFHRSHKDSL